MTENSKVFLIITIILGMIGLGLGGYSVYKIESGRIQGISGKDGLDGINGINGTNGIDGKNGTDANAILNIYSCSNQLDIQNAISNIGNGMGKIIITQSIVFTGTLRFEGNGSYIIESAGSITLTSASSGLFNIINVTDFTLKDIKINASSVTGSTELIMVKNVNNKRVLIENVEFFGDNDLAGTGIRVESDNVRIINCYFYKLNSGIRQYISTNMIATGNIIDICSSTGMEIWGNSSIIENNIIKNMESHGISVGNGQLHLITNNMIIGKTQNDLINRYGIASYDDNNTISNNLIRDFQNLGSGNSTGIYVATSGTYNFVINNICFNNEINLKIDGLNSFNEGNYSP